LFFFVKGFYTDLTIQICCIAESVRLQQVSFTFLSNFSLRRFLVLIKLNFKMLLNYGIVTQTPHQIEPIEIWPPGELVKAYEQLGINTKLKLTG